MKKIIMFFALLCCSMVTAQVQKLGELSSGIFIDSSVIMEDDESDVYGYCLLYQIDRKSKEVYDLEYVILDKNLNKLTSINITQSVFKSVFSRTRTQITFAKKIDNQLIVGINDRLTKIEEFDLMPVFNYRFVNINLTDFSFSKEYKYQDFTKKEMVYKAGDKLEFDDIWYLQSLQKTNSNYLLAFACPEYNPKTSIISSMITFDYKRKQSVKKFSVLDKDLKVIWSKNINADEKTACRYDYLDSDTEVLLLKKQVLNKDKTDVEVNAIEIYNIKTGDLLSQITLDDKQYNLFFDMVKINNGSIHIFTEAKEKSKKGWSLGVGHLTFDKQTGKEVNRDIILWKNFMAAIPGFTENGSINKEYITCIQDYIFTPKGAILLAIETYNFKSGYSPLKKVQSVYAQLKEMYLVELNQDDSITFVKKLDKQNSVEVYAGISEADMKQYGVFDYMFCQKLNKDGDFVMYYTINDQLGTKKKVAKKPLWTLGFISNVTGEYGFETLPLYGDDLKIYPGLAKNGFIRLLEVNTKTGQAEMRLEKINY